MKKNIKIGFRKNIALIAHDHQKLEILEWAKFNREVLKEHNLFATGTTGAMLARECNLEIFSFNSGPLGGDQQIGAKISEGAIDFLIFFWDPMEPQPHDPDVKALLRLAVVWNIPVACNRSTADFLISSSLMSEEYDRIVSDYQNDLKSRLETFKTRDAEKTE
jgi:methylglyoxal synthase